MKKITIYLMAVMLVTLFTKCVDDTGSTTYRAPGEVTPVITSELNANYTALMYQPFVLEPVIAGDEADYDFLWYTYPSNVTTTNRRDTIGHERKLDYNMTLATGPYRLIFEMKDKKTGVATFQRTLLTVSSIYSKGYFINKYEDGFTDVDFINPQGVLQPNILKTINGAGLPGKPIRSTFSDRYCYPDANDQGVTLMKTWAPTFMVCTDEDMAIYRGNEMTMIYDWDHAFMEPPAVKKPQGVWGTATGFMMLNNGALHVVAGNTSSTGQFGYSYPTEGLKMTGIGCVVNSNMMFFDENAGAIVGYSQSADRYAYTTPVVGNGNEDRHFTNQEVLYMGTQHNYVGSAARGWALLKSKVAGEEGKLRLIDVNVGMFNSYHQLVYYGSFEIPAAFSDVGDGKVFCVQSGGGTVADAITSILYYSAGDNKVHYYNQNNQTQKLDAVTIPADEQIVYIYHNYDWACNNHASYAHPDGDAPNEFLVLSNKAGNWTLRVYEMEGQTYEIKGTTPKKIYTGTGEAKNLMYREQHTTRTW